MKTWILVGTLALLLMPQANADTPVDPILEWIEDETGINLSGQVCVNENTGYQQDPGPTNRVKPHYGLGSTGVEIWTGRDNGGGQWSFYGTTCP